MAHLCAVRAQEQSPLRRLLCQSVVADRWVWSLVWRALCAETMKELPLPNQHREWPQECSSPCPWSSFQCASLWKQTNLSRAPLKCKPHFGRDGKRTQLIKWEVTIMTPCLCAGVFTMMAHHRKPVQLISHIPRMAPFPSYSNY